MPPEPWNRRELHRVGGLVDRDPSQEELRRLAELLVRRGKVRGDEQEPRLAVGIRERHVVLAEGQAGIEGSQVDALAMISVLPSDGSKIFPATLMPTRNRLLFISSGSSTPRVTTY